jgi:hypothetical protein
MATDYVLCGVATAIAYALRRRNRSRAAASWTAAFLAAALSAFVGGTVHGFGPDLPAGLRQTMRAGSVMGLGLVNAGMLAGVVFASVRAGRACRVLLGLVGAKLLLYLAWTASHPEFRYAAWDGLPTGVVVLGFLVLWRRGGGPVAAGWGALGLVLSILGAVLQQARVGLHAAWLNHNDLYHVIQAGALWLVYQAGRRLRDAD